MDEKFNERDYRVKRTQLIIDQQKEAKFFLHTSSFNLLGLIAIFVTLSLGVLQIDNFYIKIALILPFILVAISAIIIIGNLDYRPTNTGVNVPTIEENIDKSLSENLRIEFNANRIAISENDETLLKMRKDLRKSIFLLMIAVALSAILLIISEFMTTEKNKEKLIIREGEIEVIIKEKRCKDVKEKQKIKNNKESKKG